MSRFCCLVLTLIVASTSIYAQQTREAELKAAIAARPTELESYVSLARMYSATNRTEEAEAVLRQALAIHRDSAAVYDALAALYVRTDPEKVLAITDEWIKVAPADAKPYLLAADVHRARARATPADALQHLQRALTLLNTAVEHGPEDPMPAALRMAIMTQMVTLTTDPAEKAALQRELEAARRAVEKQFRDGGGRVMSASPAPPPGAASVNAAFANAVRVGGNVRAPQKIKDVKPVMPELAVQARVQGVVIIEIVIDESGHVADARILRSIPLLDQAALDAVRQWQFTPTVPVDKPVPVIMTVTVQFSLAPGQ